MVYIGCRDKHIYDIDATLNCQLWTFDTGGKVWSSPAVVDSTVYVGGIHGTVYALEESEE